MSSLIGGYSMFEFLKKLVSRAVPITVTNFHDPVLAFTSEKSLKRGPLDVEATVLEERIRLLIQVEEVKEGSYLGRVIEPEAAIPFLAEQFPDEPRKATRFTRSMRVLSKELKGFKATSRDISVTGVRLEADAPLPPGSFISMQIDLDDARSSSLNLEGEVKWCVPKSDVPSALLGVEFEEPDSHTQSVLANFLQTLESE